MLRKEHQLVGNRESRGLGRGAGVGLTRELLMRSRGSAVERPRNRVMIDSTNVRPLRGHDLSKTHVNYEYLAKNGMFIISKIGNFKNRVICITQKSPS